MNNSWHSRVKDSISHLEWFCKLESGLLELNLATIFRASKILQQKHNMALCFHDSTAKKVLYDNRLTFAKHDDCVVLIRQKFEISFSFSRSQAEQHDLYSCFWLPLQNALIGKKRKKAHSVENENEDEKVAKRTWKGSSLSQFKRFILESLNKKKPRGYGAIRILWLQSCFLVGKDQDENGIKTEKEEEKKELDRGRETKKLSINSSHDSNHYFENQFGYRVVVFHRWNRLEKVLTVAIKPKYLKTKNHACFAFFTKTSRQIPTINSENVCSCCGIEPKALTQWRFSALVPRISPISRIYRWYPNSVINWINNQGRCAQYVLVAQEDGSLFYQYCDQFSNDSCIKKFLRIFDLMEFATARHKEYGLNFKRNMSQFAQKQLAKNGRDTFAASSIAKWASCLDKAVKKMVIIFQCQSGASSILVRTFGIDVQLAEWNTMACKKDRLKVLHKVGNPAEIYGFAGHNWQIAIAESMSLALPSQGIAKVEQFSQLVSEWFSAIFEHYEVEVVSGLIFSLPMIAQAAMTFKACSTDNGIQMAFSRLPLALNSLLKSKSLYQIYEVAFSRLSRGDAMSPEHEPLRYAWESDWSLCFSSIMAEKESPIGPPLVFSKCETIKGRWFRPGPHPYSSCEFQIISAIVHQWYHTDGISPIDVFSQFSVHGSFTVEKKSLDLLLVYRKKSKLTFSAFQIHHQYTHGCSVCPPLPSYSQNQTLKEVSEKSAAIDLFWKNYCQKCLNNADFRVIYACHPFQIGGHFYRDSIDAVKQMGVKLPLSFDIITKRHVANYAEVLHLAQRSDLITFIIAEGECFFPEGNDGAESNLQHAVFTHDELGQSTVMRKRTNGPTLFTGDYFAYLVLKKNFRVNIIHHLMLFATTPRFKSIFLSLSERRNQTGFRGQVNISVLKPGLNGAVGMMGRLGSVGQITHVVAVTREKPISTTSWHSTYQLSLTSSPNYIRITRSFQKIAITSYNLPAHIHVLSGYRLKLLQFIDACSLLFIPKTWRLLRVKADAVLIGFARPSISDCARPDLSRSTFYRRWGKFVSRTKTMGKLTKIRDSGIPRLHCQTLTRMQWDYSKKRKEKSIKEILKETQSLCENNKNFEFCCLYSNSLIHLKRK